jgi:diguanylate cyclase (GGDEF)-like protein
LIVLTHASPDLAWRIAERVRTAVEALTIVNPGVQPVDGSTGIVTISLGVAFAQEDVAPETVAKWADDALYDAKRSGRNIVFLSNAHATADDMRLARQPHSPGISAAHSTRMMS